MYYCESDKPSIFLMKGYLKLRLQSLSFLYKDYFAISWFPKWIWTAEIWCNLATVFSSSSTVVLFTKQTLCSTSLSISEYPSMSPIFFVKTRTTEIDPTVVRLSFSRVLCWRPCWGVRWGRSSPRFCIWDPVLHIPLLTSLHNKYQLIHWKSMALEWFYLW